MTFYSRQSTRRFVALTAILAVGIGFGVSSGASGDTETFSAAEGPQRAYAIQSVTVDNDGPLSIVVTHRNRNWRGKVKLFLSTPDQTERVAVVRRPNGAARFATLGVGAWPCDGNRTLASSGRITTLALDRSCLPGSDQVSVRVVVHPRKQRPQSTLTTTAVAQQSRPNILFFLTDDMRLDDLEAMPKTRAWIGDPGSTWTNAFAPFPVCCPARSTILKGQYAQNHGVLGNALPYAFNAFDDTSTIATWLDEAGYQTSLLGKYLNQYGAAPVHGQSSGSSVDYVPPGWDEWAGSIDGGVEASDPDAGGTYNYFDTTISTNTDGLKNFRGQYQTTVYAQMTAERVARQASEAAPFFDYVAFTAPHSGRPTEPFDPQQVPRGNTQQLGGFPTPAVDPTYRGKFDDVIHEGPASDWELDDTSEKPRAMKYPPLNDEEKAALVEVQRQRWEALAAVDDAVDQVMTALQSSGELSNTYVVFTSDNGYFMGEQGRRFGKNLPYDPAIRIPMLIRGPGIPALSTRTDPFSLVDLAPTFMEMAGLEAPASVDGQGRLGVAQNGDIGWRVGILLNSAQTGPVERTTDMAGVPLDAPGAGPVDVRTVLGVRTAQYTYLTRPQRTADGGTEIFEELYDDVRDPAQYANLASDPSYLTVLNELRQQLADLRACSGATCRQMLPAHLQTSGAS